MIWQTQLELPYDIPPGATQFWVYVYPTDEPPEWALLIDKRIVATIEIAESFEELVGRVIKGKQVAMVEVAAWAAGLIAPRLVRRYLPGEIPQ